MKIPYETYEPAIEIDGEAHFTLSGKGLVYVEVDVDKETEQLFEDSAIKFRAGTIAGAIILTAMYRGRFLDATALPHDTNHWTEHTKLLINKIMYKYVGILYK